MAKKTVSRAKSDPPAEVAAPVTPVVKAAAAKPRARKTAPPAAKTANKKVRVAPKKPTKVSLASEPTDEDIRVRAYHRYLERGGNHGMDFEDWLAAKRDLQSLTSPAK